MCGLCGVVYTDAGRPVDEERLTAMRDCIAHRGPDDAGSYVALGVGLGSRRLSIVDLSARGHMPMKTPDGRFHIVYNGEVYNASDLRHELEAGGHVFESRTDTEVVLRLFAVHGPASLERLNGMFAIAIWDTQHRTLFLARDRLGIKPLYYTHTTSAFHFASEAKALFAGGVEPVFDASVWEELLCFRYVAGATTPYVGVRRLLPGHFLLWHDGQIQVHRWWNLAQRTAALRDQSQGESLERWYRESFDDAVALRRISDVPVGVLLSGGLDSGTVAASLASLAGSGVHSFTVSFDADGYDESPLARLVAKQWGLHYHDIRVGEGELLPRLLRASWLNDEPLAHGNELHLWAVSELARPIVTVLLSGEGADETLGGYVRYRPLNHPVLIDIALRLKVGGVAARAAHARLRKLGRMLGLGSRSAMVLFNACDVLPRELSSLGIPPSAGGEPWEYRRAMAEEADRLYPGDSVRQAMYLDQHTFLVSLLDRNDRMTMGASIECRVPFLDYRLVERLSASPTDKLIRPGPSKAVLRGALGDRLPEQVLKGRKWGFGVPWDRYLREVPDLRELVLNLPDTRPIADGPFERTAVQSLVRAFMAGDRNTNALLRQLVLIAVWHKATVEAWTPARRSLDRAPAIS